MCSGITDNTGLIYNYIKQTMNHAGSSFGMDEDDIFQEAFVVFLAYCRKNVERLRLKKQDDLPFYAVLLFKRCVKSTYVNNLRKRKREAERASNQTTLGGSSLSCSVSDFECLNFKIHSEQKEVMDSKNVRDFCKRNKVGYLSYKKEIGKLKGVCKELFYD